MRNQSTELTLPQGINPEALKLLLSDLVKITTYAKRKGVTFMAVKNAIKTGRILTDDLLDIDGITYIRWSQYREVFFNTDYGRKKSN